MDRIVPSCQLNRAEFVRATDADDEEIRALLRTVPMEGKLQIGFEREPSYFACPAPAGIEEHTLVARRNGHLLSVGSWSVRDVWLEGEPACIGYLHGLRMAPGTGGAMRVLREGYARLAEDVRNTSTAGWFTSVDADNTRARRVFESRASGLPRYRRMAEYLTRVMPVPRRGGILREESVKTEEELTEFFQREGSRHDLALTWNEARWLELKRSGFTLNDVSVVRRKGRIVAAAGVWDQSSWKQVVVHGYPTWMQRLRPLLRMGTKCLGWPGLPSAGCRVPLASVFPFAVARSKEHALAELWCGVESIAHARGIDWLALGLDASDPLWQKVRMQRSGFSYRTILYSVGGRGFPDHEWESGDRIFRPECATL